MAMEYITHWNIDYFKTNFRLSHPDVFQKKCYLITLHLIDQLLHLDVLIFCSIVVVIIQMKGLNEGV